MIRISWRRWAVSRGYGRAPAILQGVWDERVGRRYYHFVYKNVLFLVLDTEDNSPERAQEIFEIRTAALEIVKEKGMVAFPDTEYSKLPEQSAGNITAGQSEYFRRAIAEKPDVLWTFLFMHKPAWAREDETNFAAIEQAPSDCPTGRSWPTIPWPGPSWQS